MPTGLPHGGCRNYNALAVGFNFADGVYIDGALGKGMPEDRIPKDIDGIRHGLTLYEESRGVKVSGLAVIIKWVELLQCAALGFNTCC